MKRLLQFALLLAALACCAPARAAVVHTGDGAGFCNSSSHSGNQTAICASTTATFTYTAIATSEDVLIANTCGSNTTGLTETLTATGWTITAVGSVTGNTTGAGQTKLWQAYAPNTSAATFTSTWSASCGGFMNDIIGEFSGGDATNFVDAENSAAGTTGCPASTVTPTVANDGLWFYCADSLATTGYTTGSYIIGQSDTSGDGSEYLILSGGSGVGQSSGFTSSGQSCSFGVAIKPASGGGATAVPFDKQRRYDELEN